METKRLCTSIVATFDVMSFLPSDREGDLRGRVPQSVENDRVYVTSSTDLWFSPPRPDTPPCPTPRRILSLDRCKSISSTRHDPQTSQGPTESEKFRVSVLVDSVCRFYHWAGTETIEVGSFQVLVATGLLGPSPLTSGLNPLGWVTAPCPNPGRILSSDL